MVIRKKLTCKPARWSSDSDSKCVRELPFLGPLRLVSALSFRSRLFSPSCTHSSMHMLGLTITAV